MRIIQRTTFTFDANLLMTEHRIWALLSGTFSVILPIWESRQEIGMILIGSWKSIQRFKVNKEPKVWATLDEGSKRVTTEVYSDNQTFDLVGYILSPWNHPSMYCTDRATGRVNYWQEKLLLWSAIHFISRCNPGMVNKTIGYGPDKLILLVTSCSTTFTTKRVLQQTSIM